MRKFVTTKVMDSTLTKSTPFIIMMMVHTILEILHIICRDAVMILRNILRSSVSNERFI